MPTRNEMVLICFDIFLKLFWIAFQLPGESLEILFSTILPSAILKLKRDRDSWDTPQSW